MASYYDPFGQMMTLSEAMNRMLQDSFVLPRSGYGSGSGQYRFTPRMDVEEHGDDYIVKLNLPGWKPQDVDVTINGNTLTVRGKETESTTEPRQGQQAQANQGGQSNQQGGQSHQQGEQQRRSFYHLRERMMTEFERSFSFPTELNANSAKAEFENGVLTLTLPKAETAKAHKIQIGGGQKQLGEKSR